MASGFRSRKRARCIEDVRAYTVLRAFGPGPTLAVSSFANKKEIQRGAYIPEQLLAQSLLKDNRNKKGKRVNRVRLKDCGEWKLWGRRPLTIEKQAVALSGERS